MLATYREQLLVCISHVECISGQADLLDSTQLNPASMAQSIFRLAVLLICLACTPGYVGYSHGVLAVN